VPIYSYDVPGSGVGALAGSVSRVATISGAGAGAGAGGGRGRWELATWPYEPLPDIKAAVSSDGTIIAVTAAREGRPGVGPIESYRLVTGRI